MCFSAAFVESWVVENDTVDHDGTEVSCAKRRYYVETSKVSISINNQQDATW